MANPSRPISTLTRAGRWALGAAILAWSPAPTKAFGADAFSTVEALERRTDRALEAQQPLYPKRQRASLQKLRRSIAMIENGARRVRIKLAAGQDHAPETFREDSLAVGLPIISLVDYLQSLYTPGPEAGSWFSGLPAKSALPGPSAKQTCAENPVAPCAEALSKSLQELLLGQQTILQVLTDGERAMTADPIASSR